MKSKVIFILTFCLIFIESIQAAVVDYDAMRIRSGKMLIRGAQKQNEELIEKAIKEGADVNYVDPKTGHTALYIIFDSNKNPRYKLFIAELLLNNKANINFRESVSGFSPLARAVRISDDSVVKFLLDHGANPNIRSKTGYTPLMTAVNNNFESKVKLLLDYKADPNIGDGNYTPLMTAVEKNSESIVKLLLDYKADPNIQNKNGETALFISVGNGTDIITKLLLNYNANPNIKDRYGYGTTGTTPLICATRQNWLQTMKLLLNAGALINLKDNSGKTALDYANNRGDDRVPKLIEDEIEKRKQILKETKSNLETKLPKPLIDIISDYYDEK